MADTTPMGSPAEVREPTLPAAAQGQASTIDPAVFVELLSRVGCHVHTGEVLPDGRDDRDIYIAELGMRRLAHSDSLTGLANRLQLAERIDAAVAALRSGSPGIALLRVSGSSMPPTLGAARI
jgi:GGDEF domain-containing protein